MEDSAEEVVDEVEHSVDREEVVVEEVAVVATARQDGMQLAVTEADMTTLDMARLLLTDSQTLMPSSIARDMTTTAGMAMAPKLLLSRMVHPTAADEVELETVETRDTSPTVVKLTTRQ